MPDLARGLALLVVQDALLALAELAAIGLAHRLLLLVDRVLLVLQPGRLLGRQLAALDALLDPLLLVFLALFDGLGARGGHGEQDGGRDRDRGGLFHRRLLSAFTLAAGRNCAIPTPAVPP